MSLAVERALAELRAVPIREASPEPAPACPYDCSGDRNGYHWHQRHGKLPACAPAGKAWRDYCREYCRTRAAQRRAERAA